MRLSVSLFKSPFWNQIQLYLLLTSLVCLKYGACKTFSSQSYSLFHFFAFFKTLAVSKSFILFLLAASFGLSALPWRCTSNSQTANSAQSSVTIKPFPTSFLGIYNLSTSGFGYSHPYIINNFLVFLSIACNSHFSN